MSRFRKYRVIKGLYDFKSFVFSNPSISRINKELRYVAKRYARKPAANLLTLKALRCILGPTSHSGNRKMSQNALHSSENSNDWMQELDADAKQFVAVLSRLDLLAARAINDLTIRRDHVATSLRLSEIREGLRVACKLAGVKLDVSSS